MRNNNLFFFKGWLINHLNKMEGEDWPSVQARLRQSSQWIQRESHCSLLFSEPLWRQHTATLTNLCLTDFPLSTPNVDQPITMGIIS